MTIIAAAKVGGILANNKFPAEFIYQNLLISSNLVHQSFISGVSKLLQIGSSCIYPKDSPQPILENYLLSSPLEPTNEPYAIAKIASIKLCESYNRQYGVDYRSIMPTNLYGPNDNFHPTNSHVLPALIQRFHDAKLQNLPEVKIWGSGKARREFLYVDDLADAALFILSLDKATYDGQTDAMVSHINVGWGEDISVMELAQLVASRVGYGGSIEIDPSKPDGTKQKLLDTKRLTTLGWKPSVTLRDGIDKTYEWFEQNLTTLRR